jgi:uncharacterized protein (TIGR03382 family)
MATANVLFSAVAAGLLLASTQARADVIAPGVVACCSTLDSYVFSCQEAGSACRFLDGDAGTCQPSTYGQLDRDAACEGGVECFTDVPCTACIPTFERPDAGVGGNASSTADGGADSTATLDAGGAGGDAGSEPSPRQIPADGSGCSTTGDGGLRALLPWLVAGAVPLLVRRRGRRGAP